MIAQAILGVLKNSERKNLFVSKAEQLLHQCLILRLINDLIHKSISCVPREYEYNQSGHINVSIDLLKKIIKDLD